MDTLGSSAGEMGSEGQWVGWGAVLIASIIFVIASLWYFRRRNKSIHWSDGEDWVAPGEWLRPFSNAEHLFACGLAVGSMDTAQVLFLKSEEPITFDLVHRALSILAERVLVLQLGVTWRILWPWYHRLKTISIPLTESNEEPLEVYKEQMNRGYSDAEQPLWRATLVHQPSTSPGTHEAVLVWTLHHVITDGNTNMVVSRDILTIINALTTGQDDTTPIRGLIPPLSESLVKTFDFLPGLSFAFFVIRLSVFKLFVWGAACLLPRPSSEKPTTYALLHDFSQEVSGQLVRRCKESGVRIHSCLLAACSLAFLRTAQKTNRKLKTMMVTHESPVNLRRNYPACHQEGAGVLTLPVVFRHQVAESQDFWALAKTIQEDLYKEMDTNGMPIRIARIGWLMGIIFFVNKLTSLIRLPPMTYSNIFLTNMGDLRKLLPTTYNGPVQLTKLLRSFGAEFQGACFGVVTQTLGGRLLISVDYYNTKTTEETAKTFMDNLTQILYDIALHGIPSEITPAVRNGLTSVKQNGHVTSLVNGSNGHILTNGHGPAKTNGHCPNLKNGNVQIISNGHTPTYSNGHIPSLKYDNVPIIRNGYAPEHTNGHISPEHTNGHISPEHTNGHISPEHTNGHISPEHTNGHISLEHTNGHISPEHTNGHISPEHTNGHISPLSNGHIHKSSNGIISKIGNGHGPPSGNGHITTRDFNCNNEAFDKCTENNINNNIDHSANTPTTDDKITQVFTNDTSNDSSHTKDLTQCSEAQKSHSYSKSNGIHYHTSSATKA